MLIRARKVAPAGGVWSRRARRLRIPVALLIAFGVSFVGGAYSYETGHFGRVYRGIKSVPSYIRVRAQLIQHPPTVRTIRIDVKFKHLLKLRDKAVEAIGEGILMPTDADFVPATISVDGEVGRAKIRLKGDWWQSGFTGDKWPLRIKMRGDDVLWGMRVFTLHHPEARIFDREWLYHKHLRREEVLGLRYSFAQLILNGDDKGIHAVEEHFSRELLESQGRREGVIIKLDEAGVWKDVAGGLAGSLHFGGGIHPHSFQAESPDVFRATRVSEDLALTEQSDAARQLLQAFLEDALPASRVFKVQELSRFLAVAEFWDSYHCLRWHNARFYYDPVEGLLEPIGFDATIAETTLHNRLLAMEEPWAKQALADPAVAAAYVSELERMTSASYLADLRAALEPEWQASVVDVLRSEWHSWESAIWGRLEGRLSLLRAVLRPANLAVAYAWPDQTPGDELQVSVGCAVRLPVELLGFQAGDGDLLPPERDTAGPVLLPLRESDPVTYVRFRVRADDAARADLAAVCRLAGSTTTQRVPVQVYRAQLLAAGPAPPPPSPAAFALQHPFIEIDPSQRLAQVRPGDWSVQGDLVVPADSSLAMEPGTTLRFAEESVFVSSGPLDFRGTAEAPIRLVAAGTSWAGIFVRNAARSSWVHVEVRDTAGIDRNGWQTTGGVTFYRSPVALSFCRFLDNSAEDALNVVRGEFDCHMSQFARCRSDAFDGDFVSGRFESCEFTDVGADGIDLSGADVEIDTAAFRGIGDKALSVGETSRLTASSIHIEDANMGVAAKDLSHVDLDTVYIRRTSTGLACYIKKREYGPATIVAKDVKFEDVVTQALVQTGSRITIDEKEQATEDVDVDLLYSAAGG